MPFHIINPDRIHTDSEWGLLDSWLIAETKARLISSLIVAAALLLHSRTGRYQFNLSNTPGAILTIDTWTGKVSATNE